jgi:hypothetical protein
MNVANVLKLAILALATAAMVVGILVIAGWLIPPNIPEQFRVILGIVIVLYGAYRFAVTYFGKRE